MLLYKENSFDEKDKRFVIIFVMSLFFISYCQTEQEE